MRQPFTQLYLHLVWATWDRMPLITPSLRQPIYGCIHQQVRKHRCEPIAIGGVEDHVHVLVQFHPMARISEVVQHAKGASSHLVTQELDPGGFFKWQGYYGAFTISKQQVPHVRDYILRQEEHHCGGTAIETLERIFRRGAPSANRHRTMGRAPERALQLSEGERAEIERRIAEHQHDPSRAIPAEVALKRLRERYG